MTKDLFGLYFFGPLMNGDTVRDSINSSSLAFTKASFGFMSRQKLLEFLSSLRRPIEPGIDILVAHGGKF